MTPTQAITHMRQVVRRQHKGSATEETYVQWLRRFMAALRYMPADLTSEQELEHFLTRLAQKQNVAASTQNQAFNAIVFFYKEVLRRPLQEVHALRAKRPAHLRHAPTLGETRALLQTVQDRAGYPTRLITRLLYGCGLRVSEPLNLRVKDLDLQKGTVVIRGAKGGKDRVVALPHELRHGYATHCLERGTNPRAIQEAMGHSNLETTMGYLHAESLSVHSPLDELAPAA